jgi:hypothetical protein
MPPAFHCPCEKTFSPQPFKGCQQSCVGVTIRRRHEFAGGSVTPGPNLAKHLLFERSQMLK